MGRYVQYQWLPPNVGINRCERREAAGCMPCWAAIERSIGKASFQQPYDFFFATLAVVVSTTPVMCTARFIRQKAVYKSFGTHGFDKGYKSPDPEIVWGAVHVLTTRELGAFPTPLQTPLDAAVSLIAHVTSGTQAGCILAEITFRPQVTPTAHQAAIGDTVYKCLSIHSMCLLFTALSSSQSAPPLP